MPAVCKNKDLNKIKAPQKKHVLVAEANLDHDMKKNIMERCMCVCVCVTELCGV